MEFRFLYITAGTPEEAHKIAEAVVGERLAACANVIKGMESVYWWQGKLTRDQETVLILKTRAELVEACAARVKSLHSYSCPCIVALPIVAGNPPYLAWLEQETAAKTTAAP